MILVWEREVLGKIFGGKVENGLYERRTNKELEVLYGESKVIGYVKAQRLRWLGHLKRMPQSRMPKMILTSTIGGKRRKGRPKTREHRSNKKYTRPWYYRLGR